jgi:TEA/ATTS domain
MTRRPLALLGPRPPHLLYNRLSARFTILLPPLVPILNLRVSSHPLLPHPLLSVWPSPPLQDVPDPPRLRRVNRVKRPSPLNGNTERCSRMVPVKSGLRASKKLSSMVRRSPPLPLSHLTCVAVSGLRQYWESPWATYSRGRSRWRNQFLVDYLKEAGIERSKKQVASHIQVLRNMWKGEKGMFHPC